MWWRLFWWIITTALTDLLQKRPPNATPAGLGDFAIPTATEGRVVPIGLGGNLRINAPNCIWYGDYQAIKRTETTGVIIKSDVTIGFTYEMALQYALMKTQVAGITGVWIGDDRVYEGAATDVVDIDRDDLFGGVDEGGGFVGRIRLHSGAEDQAVSAYLSTRITAGLPAYRGTAYIMVTNIAETGGANIGESPNLRHINIEVQLLDTVANGGLGDDLGLGNDHHIIGADGNAAVVGYQLYTNPRWGKGLAVGDVDLPSFEAAAETNFNEGIGFSMLIDEFTTTEEIQNNLEQHFDGYIGPNPVTGKFEVSLARQDYVLGDQFQVTDDNIVGVPVWNKGDWSQTFNRVRIRYADRQKEWNETHAVANAPSNRIIQGVLKSQEVRYPGVHEASVANIIVAREKKNLSRPGRSGTIELNRTAWAQRPGLPMSFTSSIADESQLPIRITKVEVGDPIDNTLVFEVVEDVFDNENPTVADPPATDFVPPVQTVDPLLAADQIAMEAPYLITRADTQNPGVFPRIVTMARRDSGSPTEYEVIRRVRTNFGSGGYGAFESSAFVDGGFMTVGTLRNAETGWQSGNGAHTIQVDPIAGSLDDLIGVYSPGSPATEGAGVAVISPGTADEEWCVFSGIVDDLAGIRLESLYRGALDTGQKPHAIGARIWFIWTGGLGLPLEQYVGNNGVEVKLLPRSPSDAIVEAEATAIAEIDIGDGTSGDDPRYLRPLLPAKLTDNNLVDFPATVDFDEVLTAPVVTPDAQGIAMAPLLRDWRWQNFVEQVLGAKTSGDVYENDQLEIEYWLYDLDTHPTPVRGDALVNDTLTASNASQTFVALKDDISASRTSNVFNARIEVEVSHEPVGQPAGRKVSREVMNYDFVANGTWVVPADSLWLHLKMNGVDGAQDFRDSSLNNHNVRPVGIVRTSTDQEVFGVSSCLFPVINENNITGDASALLIDEPDNAALGALDMDENWTLEFRFRPITQPSGVSTIFAIDASTAASDGSDNGNTGGLFRLYMNGSSSLVFGYSTDTDTSLEVTVTFATGITWSLNTWHHVAITRKNNGDGTTTFRAFIDGVVQAGESTAVRTAIGSVLNDVPLTIGDHNIYRNSTFGDGPMLNAYIDEFIFVQGFALYAAPFTPPAAELDDVGVLGEALLVSWDPDDIIQDDGWRSADEYAQPITLSGGAILDDSQAMFTPGWSLRSFGVNSTTETVAQGAHVNFENDGFPHQQYSVGIGEWTMEAFVRFAVLPSVGNPSDGMAIMSSYNRGGTGGAVEFAFFIDGNDEMNFLYSPTGLVSGNFTFLSPVDVGVLAVDTWYHFACSRIGDDCVMFKDGIEEGREVGYFNRVPSNGKAMINSGNSPIGLGKLYDPTSTTRTRSLNGWLDEPRWTTDQAIYTGAYTVPTARFTKNYQRGDLGISNRRTIRPWEFVGLWAEFEGADAATAYTELSDDNHVATFVADAQLDTAQSRTGTSSLLLDGTGDVVHFPDNNNWHFAANVDFCIEAQIRFNAVPGTGVLATIVGQWEEAGNDRAWRLYFDGDNGIAFDMWDGSAMTVSGAWSPAADTWYHVRVVRRQNWCRIFIEGSIQAEGFLDATPNNHPEQLSIGADESSADTWQNFFNGWIEDVRVHNGDYLDFDEFTAPTTMNHFPRVVFQQVVDPAIERYAFPLDCSRVGAAVVAGSTNAQFMPGDTKFDTLTMYTELGSGGNVEYAGDAQQYLDGDFTIEAWVRFELLTTTSCIVSHYEPSGSDRMWALRYDGADDDHLRFFWSTDGVNLQNNSVAWSPAVDTWYHVAVTRNGDTLKMFIDGTDQTLTTPDDITGDTFHDASAEVISVGELGPNGNQLWDGSLEGVRITKDVSLYNGNFTVPAAAHPRI